MGKDTYRIGEAAKLLGLETYVLRYWETEFPQLSPVRTPKGQRLYTEKTLATLFAVRELLHERGMTIEGARRILAGAPMPGAPAEAGNGAAASPPAGTVASTASAAPIDTALRGVIRDLRNELAELRDHLRTPAKD